MKNLLVLLSCCLCMACGYKPSVKMTVTNASDRTIKDIRIGHNNPLEAIIIPSLAPHTDTNVVLHFNASKKQDGRYWISTGDGFIDSFGTYTNGLPTNTWIGITHTGGQIEVQLQ